MILTPITRGVDRLRPGLPRYSRWTAAIDEVRRALAADPQLRLAFLAPILQEIDAGERPAAACDLIAEHLGASWRCGHGLRLEAYLASLAPQLGPLASAARVPADLVQDEFLARHVLPGGDRPDTAEYARRFPGRLDVRRAVQAHCVHGDAYVIIRRIGRGGMCDVFAACDRRAGRMVAIKRLRATTSDSATAQQRLRSEAATTARLDHPSIPRVHEIVDEAGSAPFFVMDLRGGHQLTDTIRAFHFPTLAMSRTDRRNRWDAMLAAFEQVCAAVAHAHDRGVWHLDLKPGNILVAADGTTTVLDWGTSRARRSPEPDDGEEIAGTPEYMPPEIVGGQANEQSDVFGMGAVLFEVLTGEPPHAWPTSARPSDWRAAILRCDLAPPRHRNPHTPRQLDAACRQALARDPTARYPDVAALARAVRAGACHRRAWPPLRWLTRQ